MRSGGGLEFTLLTPNSVLVPVMLKLCHQSDQKETETKLLSQKILCSLKKQIISLWYYVLP